MRTTTTFNGEAWQVELRRLEEVGLAFDAAQDELCRLLEDREVSQWELGVAAKEADRRFAELAYQQDIVRWCRRWVHQQREEAARFQPTVERLRHRYGNETSAWRGPLEETEGRCKR